MIGERKNLHDCDIEILKNFLVFCEKEMWKPIGSDLDCSDFYKNKTMNRLEMFLSNRDESYKKTHNVNGVEVESIEHLINKFDWDSVKWKSNQNISW